MFFKQANFYCKNGLGTKEEEKDPKEPGRSWHSGRGGEDTYRSETAEEGCWDCRREMAFRTRTQRASTAVGLQTDWLGAGGEDLGPKQEEDEEITQERECHRASQQWPSQLRMAGGKSPRAACLELSPPSHSVGRIRIRNLRLLKSISLRCSDSFVCFLVCYGILAKLLLDDPSLPRC